MSDRQSGPWKPVERSFHELKDFSTFISSRPETCDRVHIDRGVQALRGSGIALTRRFGWASVEVRGSNYREDLILGNLSSRDWALLDLLDAEIDRRPTTDILCFEESDVFSRMIRSLYARSICCVPSSSAGLRARRPTADPTNLGFADQSFDAVVFNETLHQMHNVISALSEACRVMRPGGLLLATFPFACMSEGSHQADQRGPEVTSSVLGWEIVGIAEQCEFSGVGMVYIADLERGIVGGDLDGVFILIGRAPC